MHKWSWMDYNITVVEQMGSEQTEGGMASIARQMGSMPEVREESKLLHVHSNTLWRWIDWYIIKAYCVGPHGGGGFRAEDKAVLLLEENKGLRVNADEGNQLRDTRLEVGYVEDNPNDS
jgi:hypothetical protein